MIGKPGAAHCVTGVAQELVTTPVVSGCRNRLSGCPEDWRTTIVHWQVRQQPLNGDSAAVGAFRIRSSNGNPAYSMGVSGDAYQCLNGEIVPLVDDAAIESIDAAVDELQEQMVPTSVVDDSSKEPVMAIVETEESVAVKKTVQATRKTQEDNSTRSRLWIWLIPVLASVVAVVVSVAIYRTRSSS